MNPVRVTLSIKENNHRITLGFSEYIKGGGGEYPWYEGSYDVTPTVDGLTLETEKRSLLRDIKVNKIPFSSVTNPQGGQTINIAFN